MPAYRDNRTGAWRYRKRIDLPNGTSVRITGTPNIDTKAAAEHAERMHVLRVTNPEVVPDPPPPAAAPEPKERLPTIREFATRFMAEYKPRQKPGERKTKKLILDNQLLPYFGHLRVDEIDQSHINAYVATLKVSVKTINNRLAVLSTLLKYAGPRGCKLIQEPTLSFHVDGMDAEVIAVPAADVAKLVRAADDDRYKVAVLLASEAGLRIGEIRGLQWTDIKDGRLTVRRSADTQNNVGAPKHNKMRTVKLSLALKDALEKLPRRGLWVIGRLEDGGLLDYWSMLEAIHALYVSAKVDVPKSETGRTMPWHSLRHTFGTECAARGVPVPTIKELMGHSDIKTTMRYVTVTESQRDEAIELAFGVSGQPVGNRTRKRA
jgi:integrase